MRTRRLAARSRVLRFARTRGACTRGYSFDIDGSLSLVTNCSATKGRHDYVTGSKVAGPNVFHGCTATQTYADIGPHHRHATGLLFDRVDGGQSRVWDRGNMGSGHGWSGATTMLWNVVARDGQDVRVDSPPGTYNWCVGCVAAELNGEGLYDSGGLHVFPASL